MRIAGRRVKRTKLVQTDRLIVAVEVEMVIPESDPSEPCLEPETFELLREVHEHAVEGDIAWLKTKGKVYQLVDESPQFIDGLQPRNDLLTRD
jgi:hypothetical protein